MLVPVIGLVQLGAIARADRYTYLSQIGLSIAVAWSVWSSIGHGNLGGRRAGGNGRWRPFRQRQSLLLAAVGVASNFLLARCRNPVEAYDRLHRAQCAGSL